LTSWGDGEGRAIPIVGAAAGEIGQADLNPQHAGGIGASIGIGALDIASAQHAEVDGLIGGAIGRSGNDRERGGGGVKENCKGRNV